MSKMSVKTVLSLSRQEDTLRKYKRTIESLLGEVNQGEWVQYAKVKGINFESQHTGNVVLNPNYADDQELQQFIYDVVHEATQLVFDRLAKKHEDIQTELQAIDSWLSYK